MAIQIKHRISGAVMFSLETGNIKLCLQSAVQSGAYLRGAYLSGADLRGAYLSGAYLSGAKVDGFLLVGKRPVLQLGPLGSRSDYLLAVLTEEGIRVRAGCFTGTLSEFSEAVKKEHKDGIHGREYAAAIQMIEAHAAIWTHEVEDAKAAA